MSTIIVIAFYTDKLGEYLFGTKAGNIIRWLSTFMIILAIFLSFDNAGTFLDITLGLVVIPVSYTHLDVYKRQILSP